MQYYYTNNVLCAILGTMIGRSFSSTETNNPTVNGLDDSIQLCYVTKAETWNHRISLATTYFTTSVMLLAEVLSLLSILAFTLRDFLNSCVSITHFFLACRSEFTEFKNYTMPVSPPSSLYLNQNQENIFFKGLFTW